MPENSRYFLMPLDFGPSFAEELLAMKFEIPATSLLHLPNEVIHTILKPLHSPDLLRISFTCRRLHFLALSICVERFSVQDLWTGELVLFSQAPVLDIDTEPEYVLPRILRMSLYTPPLKKMRCTFHHTQHTKAILSQIQHLMRLLSRISFAEVILDFRRVDWHKDQKFVKLQPFLDLLSQQSGALTMQNGLEPELAQRPTIRNLYRRSPLAPLRRTITRLYWSGRQTIPHSTTAASLLRRKANLGYIANTSLQFDSLHTFRAESPSLFHAPLVSWMLQTLNTASITTLSFRNVRITPLRWSTFLAALSMHALSKLTLPVCNIPPGDILTFLVRHPTIKGLTLASDQNLEVLEIPNAGDEVGLLHCLNPFRAYNSSCKISSSRLKYLLHQLSIFTVDLFLPFRGTWHMSRDPLESFPLDKTFGFVFFPKTENIEVTLRLSTTFLQPMDSNPADADIGMIDTSGYRFLQSVQCLELVAELPGYHLLPGDFVIFVLNLLKRLPKLRTLSFVDFFAWGSRLEGILFPLASIPEVVTMIMQAHDGVESILINDDEKACHEWARLRS